MINVEDPSFVKNQIRIYNEGKKDMNKVEQHLELKSQAGDIETNTFPFEIREGINESNTDPSIWQTILINMLLPALILILMTIALSLVLTNYDTNLRKYLTGGSIFASILAFTLHLYCFSWSIL